MFSIKISALAAVGKRVSCSFLDSSSSSFALRSFTTEISKTATSESDHNEQADIWQTQLETSRENLEPTDHNLETIPKFSSSDTFREDIWKKRLLDEVKNRTEIEEQPEDCVLEDLKDVLDPLQQSSYELQEDYEEEVGRRHDNLTELWHRDVSGIHWLRHLMQIKGLPPEIKRKLHGPQHRHHWASERRYLQERYARYGRLSGVNPGLMWPTEEELLEKVWMEKEREPELFKTILDCQKRREEKAEMEKERRREIERNEEAYGKVLEEYEGRLKTAAEHATQIQREKQEKIREIQEYFGYEVDADDPRFQALMDKKEQEEKKAQRLAKKREREMKTIAQLEATAEAIRAADQKK